MKLRIISSLFLCLSAALAQESGERIEYKEPKTEKEARQEIKNAESDRRNAEEDVRKQEAALKKTTAAIKKTGGARSANIDQLVNNLDAVSKAKEKKQQVESAIGDLKQIRPG